MPRYFLRLAYNGAPYHGWQSQPNASSVQQHLEQALATLLRMQSVPVTGAGRTDAGVNARCMFAHFDAPAPIADSARLIRSLNSILGRDIVVYDLIPVHPEAHARFDATSRTYKYFTLTRRSPFDRFSWFSPSPLNFEAMNLAADSLLQFSDFTSFSKLHTDVKTNICHVTHARWTQLPDNPSQWVFTITADRFLRNMVRAIVGTLVDVGREKISLDRFRDIVLCKDRCAAGTSMPGEALFLWDITYPYI